MNAHLGIDIGGSAIKIGVIDAEGHILLSDRMPIDLTSREATVGCIVACVQKLTDWCGRAGHKPLSVGVGSPGTIDRHTGMVQPPTPNVTPIIGVDFVDVITRATGLPTAVDNDANCAAWAEHRYGAGRGINNLICMTVGSGIGSGFIVDGRIFSGSSGAGGELGHVSIEHDGPRCGCGNRGCLELYTSTTAIVRAANDASGANGKRTIADLFDSARRGDSGANEVIEQRAAMLGIGLVNAINLFDPEAVIIGGGIADVDTDGRFVRAVAKSIHALAFSESGKHLPVAKAALGNDAGFIGAASLGASLVTA